MNRRFLVFVALTASLASFTSGTAFASEVKAVLFDSYGTLVSWEGVERKVDELMTRKGVDINADAFLGLWRSRQLTYIMYNTLVDKGFEPFSYVTRRALHTAARFHHVELSIMPTT